MKEMDDKPTMSGRYHFIKPTKSWYSLRSIILFANIDVYRHILVVDTSVLAKSNMDRRE
jgi:hypothetical protein